MRQLRCTEIFVFQNYYTYAEILWTNYSCAITFIAYCCYFSRFVLFDVILKIVRTEHKMQFMEYKFKVVWSVSPASFHVLLQTCLCIVILWFRYFSVIAYDFPSQDSFIFRERQFAAAHYLKVIFFEALSYHKLSIL